MLRFSIVVPNLNGGAVLERAIRSLLDQQYAGLQLILADGGSEDISSAIIDRCAGSFDTLIRERDNGQADALNRGFRSADGEIHGWLCSDDELLPGALAHVNEIFEREPQVDVVAGASERIFEAHETRLRTYVGVPRDAWRQMRARNVFDQPSVFWRSALHHRIGELDTSYRLAFDWEFWCRMARARAKLAVTDRALSRYYFSGTNQSSIAGSQHVEEGFRVIRKYGPRFGLLAYAFRFLYYRFDLTGCMDVPPSAAPEQVRSFQITRFFMERVLGRRWVKLYGWHFASLQQRGMDWWDYGRPSLNDTLMAVAMTPAGESIKDWTGGTLSGSIGPEMPGGIDRLNLVLNRQRLANFTREFAADAEVRDFLLLDALSSAGGLSISSTGLDEPAGSLALRSFRIWEYAWIFRVLALRRGGMKVLDLGGPLSHIAFLAAIAGNDVLSLDIDERAVRAGNATAAALGVANYRAEVCDMRDLSRLASGSFSRVISCSVLEHLSASGQSQAMDEMSRVLEQGGQIGLTFDYGPPAPDGNIHLPPPHEPPPDARTVMERFVRAGLSVIGDGDFEDPVPGSLFHGTLANYTIACLFLGKNCTAAPLVPRPRQDTSLLGNLAIPNLPGLVYASSALARQRREREEQEKQTWVTRLNELEEAARERLATLERVHREAETARKELARQQFVIRKLGAALALRDKWIEWLRKLSGSG